jgi:hypothetical protein
MYLVFHQTYEPVAGSVIASALVALLPLLLLSVLLAVLKLPAWTAAVAALLTAFQLAWLVWGMGLPLTLSATTEGMALGLWPISWVVLNAVLRFVDLFLVYGRTLRQLALPIVTTLEGREDPAPCAFPNLAAKVPVGFGFFDLVACGSQAGTDPRHVPIPNSKRAQ